MHDGVSQEALKEVGAGETAVLHTGRAPATAQREAAAPVLVQRTASEAGPPLRGIGAALHVEQAPDDTTDDGVPRRAGTRVACPKTVPDA